jgi:archaellum component FlaG (FlaF/FlaG flagellin family)
VTPTTAAFSKASPADVVVTVMGGVVTELKNNVAVVNPDNWNYVDGQLTIYKEYLATQTDGEKTITIKTASGTTTLTITVGP